MTAQSLRSAAEATKQTTHKARRLYLLVFDTGGMFLAHGGGFMAQGMQHRRSILTLVGVLGGAIGLAAPLLLWLALLVGGIHIGLGG